MSETNYELTNTLQYGTFNSILLWVVQKILKETSLITAVSKFYLEIKIKIIPYYLWFFLRQWLRLESTLFCAQIVYLLDGKF